MLSKIAAPRSRQLSLQELLFSTSSNKLNIFNDRGRAAENVYHLQRQEELLKKMKVKLEKKKDMVKEELDDHMKKLKEIQEKIQELSKLQQEKGSKF